MELGLRYPPTFTQVSTTEEAAAVLRSTVIDPVSYTHLGHKGAKARSGYKRKIGFEGGQMPLRLP